MTVKRIIHIGLAKCASSFLQQKFFFKLNRKRNIYYHRKSELIDTNKYMEKSRVAIISAEGLSHCKHFPNLINTKNYNRYSCIDAVKENYPTASFILILRDKDIHIRSMYKENVRTKGCIFTFDEWINNYDKEDIDDYYNYDKYVRLLKNSFKDVYVCHYEQLISDYYVFMHDLCDFMDVPYVIPMNECVNARWSDDEVERQRLLNKGKGVGKNNRACVHE